MSKVFVQAHAARQNKQVTVGDWERDVLVLIKLAVDLGIMLD